MNTKTYKIDNNFYKAFIEEGMMKFYPAGGGFQQSMPLKEFYSIAEEIDSIPVVLEEASFSVDDSPSFKGIHNPNSNWNGWAIPYFSLEVFKEVLVMVNKNEEWLSFKEENGKYLMLDNYYQEDGWFEIASVIYNDEVYVAPDGWCWTKD